MHLPTLTSLTEGLRATLVRFPIPTVFAAIVTGLLIHTFDSGVDEEALIRYTLLAGLGFVGSLLCDLLTEARGSAQRNRLLGQAGVVVLLIIYSRFFMPESVKQPHPPFFYGYFILLFALHLGIALVPTSARGDSNRLWRFNLSCFLRYFFSSVNAALLFGGLALALLSVDKLFELGLDEELYPKLWVLCAFFAHPMLFLGGLPRLSELKDENAFPKPLRFSLCFIGLPLVALYLVILYAYLAKIVLQWSWPNGWVAMPIFVLAVISLLTYALSLPLPKTENWARLYNRWLFRLLLPLSIVLFLALQVRLGDYGMTINRYLGLALAIWLFGISLTYIIRPALKIAWMPLSLLIVSLFSIYAGPLGAFGWSERAQFERLRHMAADLGILENDALVPTQAPQDPEVVEQFHSALRYLLDNFGLESMQTELSSFLANTGEIQSSYRNSGYYLTNQVMEYLELNDELGKTSMHFYASSTVLPTQGHSWMIDYNFHGYQGRNNTSQSFTIEGIKLNFTPDNEANQLTIKANDGIVTEIDLSRWAADVKEAVKKHGNSSPEPLIWLAASKGWRFSFVCTNAQLKNNSDAFQSARLMVFLTPPPVEAARQ
jgi:hypothetical protein